MQNNIVLAIFDSDETAVEAFGKLMKKPYADNWTAPEIALIKNDEEDGLRVLAGVGTAPEPISGKGKGIVLGGLLGLITGSGIIPIVICSVIGGATGQHIANRKNLEQELANSNAVITVASKVYEGETAIAAFVSEEEPAFDSAFEGFNPTIVRFDAADIAEDVDRLYEYEAAVGEQVFDELKADRKAARAERREAIRARIHAQLQEYAAATNRSMGFE